MFNLFKIKSLYQKTIDNAYKIKIKEDKEKINNFKRLLKRAVKQNVKNGYTEFVFNPSFFIQDELVDEIIKQLFKNEVVFERSGYASIGWKYYFKIVDNK